MSPNPSDNQIGSGTVAQAGPFAESKVSQEGRKRHKPRNKLGDYPSLRRYPKVKPTRQLFRSRPGSCSRRLISYMQVASIRARTAARPVSCIRVTDLGSVGPHSRHDPGRWVRWRCCGKHHAPNRSLCTANQQQRNWDAWEL